MHSELEELLDYSNTQTSRAKRVRAGTMLRTDTCARNDRNITYCGTNLRVRSAVMPPIGVNYTSRQVHLPHFVTVLHVALRTAGGATYLFSTNKYSVEFIFGLEDTLNQQKY